MTILNLAQTGANHTILQNVHGATTTILTLIGLMNINRKNNIEKIIKPYKTEINLLLAASLIHGSLSLIGGFRNLNKYNKIITSETAEEISFEFFFATNLTRDIDVNTSFSELAIKSAVRALFKNDTNFSAKYEITNIAIESKAFNEGDPSPELLSENIKVILTVRLLEITVDEDSETTNPSKVDAIKDSVKEILEVINEKLEVTDANGNTQQMNVTTTPSQTVNDENTAVPYIYIDI